MEYGYTQLEGAIGLMPAKLGPNDKTPAYILRRDNFWKVAAASFILIVGLAGLYFGTNHDLWKTTHQLETEVRHKRQSEFGMATKLANLELQLENQLQLEGRQGILAEWYLEQMDEVEQQNKNEFMLGLNKVAGEVGLSGTQEKELLELFVQEMDTFTAVSHRLAAEVTKKLENEARHAKNRLQLLQHDFASLVESEKSKRDDYLHNEYKESEDYDGDGYIDGVEPEFENEEEKKAYLDRKAELQKIRAQIDKFFAKADLYNKFYVKVNIDRKSDLYNQLMELKQEAQEADNLENLDEKRRAMKGIKKRIMDMQKELALHKVTPFNPKDQTTYGYLNAIVMNINWPRSYATVQKLRARWDENRTAPLEMLRQIEDAIRNDVPVELLVDDATPLLGLKVNAHYDYLKKKDELQKELDVMAKEP